MKIYGDIRSGNCYKLKLLAHLLDLDYEWIDINIMEGDTQTEDFLAKNPNGKIPLLELDSGDYLSESNAILNYLAQGTDLLPEEPLARARVLEWQFFEQYSHEPYIAVARFINKFLGFPEDRRAEYQAKQAGGHKALKIMEQQLKQTPYLTGDKLTIADIALFGYTPVAEEGGFDLQQYPAILSWINKVENHPKYVGRY